MRHASRLRFATLYAEAQVGVPFKSEPDQHTMSPADFRAYIHTKFTPAQMQMIQDATHRGTRIEVHGVFHGHLECILFLEGLTRVGDAATMGRSKEGKRFNVWRPVFHACRTTEGDHVLLITTFPSREYAEQVAGLVSSVVDACRERLVTDTSCEVRFFFYPATVRELSHWSGLAEGLRGGAVRDRIVVMGEVEAVRAQLLEEGFVQSQRDYREFGPFGSYGLLEMTLRRNSKGDDGRVCRVVLLGVKYCYWGNPSGAIAEALVDAGAKSVIYAAKAGNFVDPKYIGKVVVPRYIELAEADAAGDLKPPASVRVPTVNDAFARYSDAILSTGTHVTVPTVHGQSRANLGVLKLVRPSTIDAEAGHIARGIMRGNESRGIDATFGCIFDVTDYLCVEPETDQGAGVPHNQPGACLAATSTVEYKSRRRHALAVMGHVIASYVIASR